MEIKVRKTALTILGTLLLAGSTVQVASAAQHHMHDAPLAVSEQFRNANNSSDGHMISSPDRNRSCQNREPGNPYSEQNDYMAWSAWRDAGGWDSRNDCW